MVIIYVAVYAISSLRPKYLGHSLAINAIRNYFLYTDTFKSCAILLNVRYVNSNKFNGKSIFFVLHFERQELESGIR